MNYPQEQVVYVLFSHDVPSAQPVDIFLNDTPVVRGLSYRQMSNFIPLPKGMYTVKVYSQNQLLLNQNMDFDDNKLVRIISPEGETIKLSIEKVQMPQMMTPQMGIPYQQPYQMFEGPWQQQLPQIGIPYQPYSYPQQGQMYDEPWQPQVSKERDKPLKKNARVRFIHLSPNAPSVDITLPNGTVIFEDIPYKGVTTYGNISPGTYTLQVRPTGTDNVVLTIPNFTIGENDVKTIYAVGLVNGSPTLEAFVLSDRIF